MKCNRIRFLAVAVAVCLCLLTGCADSGAPSVSQPPATSQTTESQVDGLTVGQQISVEGTPDYQTKYSDDNGNYFHLTSDGDWYVALGATSVSQIESAVHTQKVKLYGSYEGKNSSGQPVINIQAGEIEYGGKRVKTLELVSGGQKVGLEVWIPTNGGTKYHSKSTCSGMKNPMKVDISVAKANGYTACKKCY